jgi:hypothetical protein
MTLARRDISHSASGASSSPTTSLLRTCQEDVLADRLTSIQNMAANLGNCWSVLQQGVLWLVDEILRDGAEWCNEARESGDKT